MKGYQAVLVAAAVVFAAACSDREPIAPAVPQLGAAELSLLPPGSQVVEGTTGPGSQYALFFPPVWNGDLVLYAHGYRDPALPPALPEVDPLPAVLLGLGYGVAYSSFSETGFALKDGATRTHQLRGLFASRFRPADRVYVIGHSLGGMIALMLAERHPGIYAGALPMCTFVGGSQLQLEYIFNVRVLFDYFFPGVIPGDVLNVPAGLDFETQVVPAVLAALAANPLAAAQLAGIHQIQLPFANPAELANSVIRALFYQVAGTNDILQRTHGRSPVDNTQTIYSGSFDDAALNAGIQRFSSTRDAERYLHNYYEPTGRLRIPVLTLQTTGDPDTPFFHQAVYHASAADAGSLELLLQRTINRYGHCNFTEEEQLNAFLSLVQWVQIGVMPAG